VQALAHLHAGGGFAVANEQRKNVVSVSVARLDNQTEIRGQGTVVGGAGSVVIGIRGSEVVRELSQSKIEKKEMISIRNGSSKEMPPSRVEYLSRALEELSLIIRSVSDLNGLGDGLGLIFRVGHANQISVGNPIQAVARGAHLLVDLKSTTKAAQRKHR